MVGRTKDRENTFDLSVYYLYGEVCRMKAAADKERLLTLFEKLISFDSPSFGERETGDFVLKKLAELGIAAEEDGSAQLIGGNCGNLHAYFDGTIELPPLLFCAHLDTVEPSHGKKMKIDERGVITSAGDTVLGADDCAGIAAILEALTVIKENGLPHRPIELLFTVAEEPYCPGAKAFDVTALKSKQAYVFDLTGAVGDAAYQAPAIISFAAEFVGRAAHAGFSPELGLHAIKAAADAVTKIQCGRIDDETTVNIGRISGGIADNIVPEKCSLTGEIRSCSNENALRLLENVSETIEKTAQEHGVGVSISHKVNVYAYKTSLESQVVRRFEDVCGSIGLEPNLISTFGGSDHNHLAQFGVEGIVVATAMNNCHSIGEYTTVDELKRAADLALALMLWKE